MEVDKITKDFLPPASFSKLLRLDFKKRKPTRALEDISFSLKKGCILGILGPNGAGKTTLLKIISTLILPDKGSLRVNSFCLGRDDEKIKSLIGLVTSAERSLYSRLSGRQNLEFFAALYGLDKKRAKSRLEELWAFFKVDFQDQYFYSYSTGMQQKFALMRALLHNPELLLLDEPTKSLDYKTALSLRSFIKDNLVKGQGKTVIFTTHNMDEAVDFADLFLILHKGRVFALGTLEELRRKVNLPTADLGEIFLKLT